MNDPNLCRALKESLEAPGPTLQERALENWNERTQILKDTQAYFRANPHLKEKVQTIDRKFWFKLFNYAGDITTHRIAKVLWELGENS